MESAFRDLQKLREGEDPIRRQLALALMAGASVLVLVFATGVFMGEAQETGGEEADTDAPLRRLEEAAGLFASGSESPDDRDEVPVEGVDPLRLDFPELLPISDDNPDLAALVVAAQAELEHPEALGETSSLSLRQEPAEDAGEEPEGVPTAQTRAVVLPAGVGAGSGAPALIRAANHDAMVAAALPGLASDASPAGEGSAGRYTLQVISYAYPQSARAFAAGLRQRGHRAFVERAEVEERGVVWRVRIGPFETMREANRYRASFEDSEGMNTIVIRRRAIQS